MFDIESKLWRADARAGHEVAITHKASGVTRYVSRHRLPHWGALQAMPEQVFDKVCREAFHGDR